MFACSGCPNFSNPLQIGVKDKQKEGAAFGKKVNHGRGNAPTFDARPVSGNLATKKLNLF